MSDAASKDWWDKLQAVSALIASIFIPLTVLVVGNSYSRSMKDSENRIKYVELAVSILKAEPSEKTGALREWAVDVLQQQAVVPLSADAQTQLKSQRLTMWADEVSWSTTVPTYDGNTSQVEVRCGGRNCVAKPKTPEASEK